MNLVDVLRARRRIAPYVRRTPLVRSAWLSDLSGGDVSLKLESLQVSNSFKSRGAFNAVIARLERPDSAPAQLVTASAGNHGRALAAAAETFSLPLIVFTPADAPTDQARRHPASRRRRCAPKRRDYDEAERQAKAFAAEHRRRVHLAVQRCGRHRRRGHLALEIFEDAPDIDTPDRPDRRRRA